MSGEAAIKSACRGSSPSSGIRSHCVAGSCRSPTFDGWRTWFSFGRRIGPEKRPNEGGNRAESGIRRATCTASPARGWTLGTRSTGSRTAARPRSGWAPRRRRTRVHAQAHPDRRADRRSLARPAPGGQARPPSPRPRALRRAPAPDRPADEDIRLGARIIVVCDAADALTSDLPHRPAQPLDAALAELVRCAGRSSTRVSSRRSARWPPTPLEPASPGRPSPERDDVSPGPCRGKRRP